MTPWKLTTEFNKTQYLFLKKSKYRFFYDANLFWKNIDFFNPI